jgi:hypothetical protein
MSKSETLKDTYFHNLFDCVQDSIYKALQVIQIISNVNKLLN